MILPKTLALSVQLIIPVAAADGVPQQCRAGLQGNCRAGRRDLPRSCRRAGEKELH